jgi:hypothetical protein
MITGKRFVTLEEFDRFRRALIKGFGSASIQNTYIQNITPEDQGIFWPHPTNRRWMIGMANPDYTTGVLLDYGGNIAVSGGSSGRVLDASMLWIYLATNAVLNNFAYWRTENYTHTRTAHSPLWIARIKTGPDVSDMRLWAGLVSDDLTNVDDPAAGTCAIAFRYSTAIGGNFYAVTDDDSTLSATDTGITVAADTEYWLMINVETTSKVTFYINGTLVHTATANLPVSTIDFG